MRNRYEMQALNGFRPPLDDPAAQLTARQREVLELLCEGLQNKQIAYELKISETTVKVHVSEILRKLNVLSRTRAIVEMSKIDFANLTASKTVADRVPDRH